MDNLWTHHLKYYDFFQNNLDEYTETIKIHVKELKNCKNILDTGSGSGNLTLQLLKSNHYVSAIDNNTPSLKILSKKCKKFNKRLKIYEMDVSKLEFQDGEFDGASSMFVIPFIKDIEKYFKKIFRVIKPHSKLTISTWSNESTNELMKIVFEELTKKEILPRHINEWNHIQKSTQVNAISVKNAPNENQLINLLKDTGFKNIKTIKSPYGKFSYFIVCEK